MSPVSRMRPSAIAIAPDANVVKRSSIVTRWALTRIVSQSMTESIAYVPYHRTVRPRVAVARDRRVRLWLRRLGFDLTLTVPQPCGGSDSTSPSPSTSSAAYSQTDLTVGTGAVAVIGRPVTVDYTGWLYDSTRPDGKGPQFDTSSGRGPFTFTLGGGSVIAGWDRGVANMRVGGQRRLVIP